MTGFKIMLDIRHKRRKNMKIIDCDRIEINRGDRLLINYSILNGKTPYEFVETDVVGFYLYEKGKLDQNPIVEKTFTPNAGTTHIEIDISAEDMDIGNLKNVAIEYWYEITLNDEVTLGYDAKGPKILMLYPKGKK
jgi:hypothetical protein